MCRPTQNRSSQTMIHTFVERIGKEEEGEKEWKELSLTIVNNE
jgi:hypothetical protein